MNSNEIIKEVSTWSNAMYAAVDSMTIQIQLCCAPIIKALSSILKPIIKSAIHLECCINNCSSHGAPCEHSLGIYKKE